MSIDINQSQYKAVQAAIADILKDYGVEGQSAGKLRYYAAKALLYTNHHQLETKFKDDNAEAVSRNRLSLDNFRFLASDMLSRYHMEDLYVCDNCGTVADKESLLDAKNLSMRIDEGGLYTTKECVSCDALSYPLEKMIEGSVIDKLYHDKTLDVSYAHAEAFANVLLSEYAEDPEEDGLDVLMAKARLYYLDLLSQIYMMDPNRRGKLAMVLKDVNTFIAHTNDAKERNCLYVEMPDEGEHDDYKGDAETLETLALLVLSDPAAPNHTADYEQYVEDAKLVFFSQYC